MHSSMYLYCHPAVCITVHCPGSLSCPEGHLKSKQPVCILCFWGAHYLLLPDGTGECVTHCYQLSLYILCLYRVVVKALCYKPEARGFVTRWDEWILSVNLILPAALGPWVDLN
jgi:hypothetical protein